VYTVAVVATLALGIGANAATYSFANSLLLFEPPVRDPESLVRLFLNWEDGPRYGPWCYPDFADFQQRIEAFSGMTGELHFAAQLGGIGADQEVRASLVPGNYFSMLGVDVDPGRGFVAAENATPATHPVTVISHPLWEQDLGSDPAVVGKKITLNHRSFTIIGVAPAAFHGVDIAYQTDLWAPMMSAPLLDPGTNFLETRAGHSIQAVIGRLAPGVSIEHATEEANALMGELIEQYPETNTGKTVGIYPYRRTTMNPSMRDPLVDYIGLTFAAVGLTLLLACANVAGLTLARLSTRQKEIAVRLSLGASRSRVIRQLLTESGLLAVLAGIVGFLLAAWVVPLAEALPLVAAMPLNLDLTVDSRVFLFTLVVALLAGIAFGIFPALHSTREQLATAIKEAQRRHTVRSSRLRQLLVVCQVAASLVLLIGALFVGRSLLNAAAVETGLNTEQVVVASFSLTAAGYGEPEGRQLQAALSDELSQLPGVAAVGIARYVPLTQRGALLWAAPEEFEVPEGQNRPSFTANVVDHGYFDAMEIPLRRGRSFTRDDGPEAPLVLVVNETFAERFWPGQIPLGERVWAFGEVREIVGVVADHKHWTLGEGVEPIFYMPLSQVYTGVFSIFIRAEESTDQIAGSVRRRVEELAPGLAPVGLGTMRDAMSYSLFPSRVAAVTVGSFATTALLLAALGIYGVVAYTVASRTHELGVRMAMGAEARDVVQLVVGQGMRLTALGLAIGFVVTLLFSRLMTALLYDVSPVYGLAYFGGAVVLAFVAVIASYLPARRATMVDPLAALREE
jgi:predicted permease